MSSFQKGFKSWLIMSCGFLVLLLIAQDAAAAGKSTGLTAMAEGALNSYPSIGLAITGGSYVAGLAFAIAAALLFLPSILSVAGFTMFGKQGATAGPQGTEVTGEY